jgi:glutamate-1-semialdehyde 2,1-aminomutase
MDLDRLVLEARDRYEARHERSRAWFERASKVMPAGNTRSVLHFDPFPIRVTQAEGRFIHDVDGHRYVDLLGNYTAGLFGHSNHDIASAVHKAIDRGLSLGAPHEDEVILAELVTRRFPSIERVGSRTRGPRRT